MSLHPDGLTCESVCDELERLVDGDLSPAEAAVMERHLESCAGCRAERLMARQIRDELRALPHLDAPPEVIETVIETARREHEAAEARRSTGLRPSPVWAIAAALLLAAVLVPLMMRTPPVEVARVDPVSLSTMDPVELERATEEVRVALAYVGQVTRRTGLEIRDGLIVERLVVPAAEGLSSLHGAPGSGVRGEGNET
jgi:anti-sigma factor RsiW